MRWRKVFRLWCRARIKFWRRTIYVTASVAINKMESTFGDGWGMKGIRECGLNWFLIGKYAPRWSMYVVNASMRENFASLCALVLICALTYVKDQKKILWRICIKVGELEMMEVYQMKMTWRSDTADFISMLLLIKLMEINFGSQSTNVCISLFELSFP